jgi:serine protease AprX
VISSEIEAMAGESPDALLPLIVQTHLPPSAAHLGRVRNWGGRVGRTYSAINGYATKLPAWRVSQLAAEWEVERISYDAPVKAHLDIAYKAIRADQAANSALLLGLLGTPYSGKGVGIALVDTGVQLHPDLKRPSGAKQIVEVEVVGHETGLADYYGHGTHVAGILNGNGSASSDLLSYRTFKGVAPDAQIISIRALAPDGTGYTSDIITGIDWAVANLKTYNIRVLNLSLGHPVYESYATDPLCRAVAAAVGKGIVVVVAAGNDGAVGSGFGTVTSPGNEPTAVTVGAMDDRNTVSLGDDVLAWYSSKGPSLVDYVVKPDLVAPGTWIVSARAVGSTIDTTHHDLVLKIGDYKTDLLNGTQDGAYLTMSGTSLSAPLVSGTVALMLQKDPTLTPATVKARLMRSAVKDTRLVFETGAGYLDAYGAISVTGTAKNGNSPLAMAASDGNVYIQDTAILWGSAWTQAAIWGSAKGSSAGVSMTPVPSSMTSSYGAIWGGNAGARSLVDNNQVTTDCAIWNGRASSLTSTTGTVSNEAAIWTNPRK